MTSSAGETLRAAVSCMTGVSGPRSVRPPVLPPMTARTRWRLHFVCVFVLYVVSPPQLGGARGSLRFASSTPGPSPFPRLSAHSSRDVDAPLRSANGEGPGLSPRHPTAFSFGLSLPSSSLTSPGAEMTVPQWWPSAACGGSQAVPPCLCLMLAVLFESNAASHYFRTSGPGGASRSQRYQMSACRMDSLVTSGTAANRQRFAPSRSRNARRRASRRLASGAMHRTMNVFRVVVGNSLRCIPRSWSS